MWYAFVTWLQALNVSLGRRLWLKRSRAAGWSRSRPPEVVPGPAQQTPAEHHFYRLQRWRAVRYEALRRSRGRCECCGLSSWSTTLHVDHIVPRSWAPELAFVVDNLQVLCELCNLGKSNTDAIDWRGGHARVLATRYEVASLRSRLALLPDRVARVQILRQAILGDRGGREVALISSKIPVLSPANSGERPEKTGDAAGPSPSCG